MQSRTSHSHVTFRRPFQLAGMDGSAPAGRYKVALEEEQLDSLTVEAWRQTSVTLADRLGRRDRLSECRSDGSA
jgi:hypothetical protein